MKRSSRAGRISRQATLLLLLSALTGCSLFKPTPPPAVMPEAQAIRLEKGTPAPWRGWLLSDSSVAKLLEAAERGQAKQP